MPVDITEYFTTDTVNELALAEALREVLPSGFLLIADNTPSLYVDVSHADGNDLTTAEAEAVRQIAAEHDPTQPSEAEMAAETAQQTHEAQMDVIRQRAAEDPAFAALAGVLGITLD